MKKYILKLKYKEPESNHFNFGEWYGFGNDPLEAEKNGMNQIRNAYKYYEWTVLSIKLEK